MRPVNQLPEGAKLPRRRPSIPVSSRLDRTVNGIVFASKAEATRYIELRELQKVGAIHGFFRQVSLDLAGAVARIDFLVFDHALRGTDFRVWAEEVKSKNWEQRRDAARTKRNHLQIRTLYPWLGLRIIER